MTASSRAPAVQARPRAGLDCASSRHRSNVCTDTPISFATKPTLALSGGSNRATALFLNASPYRAIFHPYRPQVQDHIGATTILTRGDTQAGILLASPLRDLSVLKRFYTELGRRALNDKGAGGAQTRVLRLPNGLNMKAKYGGNFQCRLLQWEPDRRIEFEDLAETLKIDVSGCVKVAVSKPQVDSPQDAAIIMQLLSRPKLRQVWFADDSGYGSGSDADMALLTGIVRETRDPDQIDRIYSLSGRSGRKSSDGTCKWKDREDYRERSINNALKFVDENPQAEIDEARAFVETMLAMAEASGDSRKLFEPEFLADMLELKKHSLGDYDAARGRLKKRVTSIANFDDAVKRVETGEAERVNDSETPECINLVSRVRVCF